MNKNKLIQLIISIMLNALIIGYLLTPIPKLIYYSYLEMPWILSKLFLTVFYIGILLATIYSYLLNYYMLNIMTKPFNLLTTWERLVYLIAYPFNLFFYRTNIMFYFFEKGVSFDKFTNNNEFLLSFLAFSNQKEQKK